MLKVYRMSLGINDHPDLLGDEPLRYFVNPKGSPVLFRKFCEQQRKTVAVIITTEHVKKLWMYTADQIVRLDNDGFHVQKDRYGILKDRTWQQIHQCQMDGSRD